MTDPTLSAVTDVRDYLGSGEVVEAVVFGAWGWDGFSEPEPPPVPQELRGKVLSWEEAIPYMRSWRFYGGHGAPQCYAVRIWTNYRILWVTQYDGATRLSGAPRNPIVHIPDMPGG